MPALVFTSSVAVYGFAAPDTDEKGPLHPFNDYGRTKMEAEEVYQEWLKGGTGRMLTIVRPTVVFGPRNRGNVYNLLRQMASGRFAMVGSGKNVKSMAFVENVASFLARGRGLWTRRTPIQLHRQARPLHERAGCPCEAVPGIAAAHRASDTLSRRIPGGLAADLASKAFGRELPDKRHQGQEVLRNHSVPVFPPHRNRVCAASVPHRRARSVRSPMSSLAAGKKTRGPRRCSRANSCFRRR